MLDHLGLGRREAGVDFSHAFLGQDEVGFGERGRPPIMISLGTGRLGSGRPIDNFGQFDMPAGAGAGRPFSLHCFPSHIPFGMASAAATPSNIRKRQEKDRDNDASLQEMSDRFEIQDLLVGLLLCRG